MSEGYDASKVLTVVLGIVSTLIVAGVIAIITLLGNVGHRLTVLETSINENKDERRAQITELRDRVNALEREMREIREREE